MAGAGDREARLLVGVEGAEAAQAKLESVAAAEERIGRSAETAGDQAEGGLSGVDQVGRKLGETMAETERKTLGAAKAEAELMAAAKTLTAALLDLSAAEASNKGPDALAAGYARVRDAMTGLAVAQQKAFASGVDLRPMAQGLNDLAAQASRVEQNFERIKPPEGLTRFQQLAAQATRALELLDKAEPRQLRTGIANLQVLLEQLEAEAKRTGTAIDAGLRATMDKASESIRRATVTAGQYRDASGDIRTQSGLAAQSVETLAARASSAQGMMGLLADSSSKTASSIGKVGLGMFGAAAGIQAAAMVGEQLGKALAGVGSAITQVDAANLPKVFREAWEQGVGLEQATDNVQKAMNRQTNESIKLEAAGRAVARGLMEQGKTTEETIRNYDLLQASTGRVTGTLGVMSTALGQIAQTGVPSANQLSAAVTQLGAVFTGQFARGVADGNASLLANEEILNKVAQSYRARGEELPDSLVKWISKLQEAKAAILDLDAPAKAAVIGVDALMKGIKEAAASGDLVGFATRHAAALTHLGETIGQTASQFGVLSEEEQHYVDTQAKAIAQEQVAVRARQGAIDLEIKKEAELVAALGGREAAQGRATQSAVEESDRRVAALTKERAALGPLAAAVEERKTKLADEERIMRSTNAGLGELNATQMKAVEIARTHAESVEHSNRVLAAMRDVSIPLVQSLQEAQTASEGFANELKTHLTGNLIEDATWIQANADKIHAWEAAVKKAGGTIGPSLGSVLDILKQIESSTRSGIAAADGWAAAWAGAAAKAERALKPLTDAMSGSMGRNSAGEDPENWALHQAISKTRENLTGLQSDADAAKAKVQGMSRGKGETDAQWADRYDEAVKKMNESIRAAGDASGILAHRLNDVNVQAGLAEERSRALSGAMQHLATTAYEQWIPSQKEAATITAEQAQAMAKLAYQMGPEFQPIIGIMITRLKEAKITEEQFTAALLELLSGPMASMNSAGVKAQDFFNILQHGAAGATTAVVGLLNTLSGHDRWLAVWGDMDRTGAEAERMAGRVEEAGVSMGNTFVNWMGVVSKSADQIEKDADRISGALTSAGGSVGTALSPTRNTLANMTYQLGRVQ
jgi:hypothetical protein